MQKTWKMTETLTNGYSSENTKRELSNEYQHDRVFIFLPLNKSCLSIGKVNPFTSAEAKLSSKAQGSKDYWKPSKPCHVGIHLKALSEYYQMSTHLPWFQWFLSFLSSFHVDQIRNQQPKGQWYGWWSERKWGSSCQISGTNSYYQSPLFMSGME